MGQIPARHRIPKFGCLALDVRQRTSSVAENGQSLSQQAAIFRRTDMADFFDIQRTLNLFKYFERKEIIRCRLEALV